jgi:hypothetical protein
MEKDLVFDTSLLYYLRGEARTRESKFKVFSLTKCSTLGRIELVN